MKNTLSLTLALLVGLSSGALLVSDASARAASLPVPQDGVLDGRIRALEAQLGEMNMAMKSTEELLEQTVTYLEEQSKSAAKLSSALGQAEKLGFTKGINFHSREVLLKGLGGLAGKMQTNVPRLQKKPAVPVRRAPVRR